VPITLDGGAIVASLREGAPGLAGGVRLWRHFEPGRQTQAISLQVAEFGTGTSATAAANDVDEVGYVLSGEATIVLDGVAEEVAAHTGFYVRPGIHWSVENHALAPLVVVASRCPATRGMAVAARPFVRLHERAAEVTGDRWYRVLVDQSVGSAQVTQFVGAIPPGRAPDHYHQYEEVLCILAGRGRMWAGASSAPIEPGCCIYLPRGQTHCVENAGPEELRLLGVFYPAGSPAVRYPTD
jgi:mannose-6-phosphate isomerase-like protein (cupin superfamily)